MSEIIARKNEQSMAENKISFEGKNWGKIEKLVRNK